MKKVCFLLIALVSALSLRAQDEMPAGNCYTEYYTAFRDRGAKHVPDGVTKVIVSIRKEGSCKCLVGKITVKNGVPVNDLQLEREDGTFDRYKFVPSPKYQNSESRFKNYISNGMSPTYLSYNEEMINLFFIDYLNPTPANYKTAPHLK